LAFDRGSKVTIADLLAHARRTKPIVRAVGKGLEEVWALIEQGRVELASTDVLSRSELTRLIEPDLYSPMYCRLEAIFGWEKHSKRGERLVMRNMAGRPTAAVLSTGDPEWIFVQTNVRYDMRDAHNWKFLDRLATIGSNGVFNKLVGEYGVDSIVFETKEVMNAFAATRGLGAFKHFFEAADEGRDSNDKDESDATEAGSRRKKRT
jgi:hypothetical protein